MVGMMLFGIAVVGSASTVIETFKAIRIPLSVYPSLLLIYLGALIAMTYLLSYDYAISRNHPLEPQNSERAGAAKPTQRGGAR